MKTKQWMVETYTSHWPVEGARIISKSPLLFGVWVLDETGALQSVNSAAHTYQVTSAS